MRVRVYFTQPDGVENTVDYVSNLIRVFNDSARDMVLEMFWRDFGCVAVDDVVELCD